jgi:HNH endonuclease
MLSSTKKWVAERARYCCEYCLTPADFSPDPFSMDHIISTAQGGSDVESNLAFSCQGCNNFKHAATEAVDPETGLFVLLYNPRIDEWLQHFQWLDNFSKIEGITPICRATVGRLQLNRLGLLNLRVVLRQYGKHPPGWWRDIA